MQSLLSCLDSFNIFDQIFSINFFPIVFNSFSVAEPQQTSTLIPKFVIFIDNYLSFKK
jgi:hypothetical protein